MIKEKLYYRIDLQKKDYNPKSITRKDRSSYSRRMKSPNEYKTHPQCVY